MRWLLIGVLLAGMAMLAGCGDRDEADTGPRTSLLLFRYDPAREIVTATTMPLAVEGTPTAGQYADALESQPGMSYTPSTSLRLADPQATVTDGALTVNYRQADGLGAMSSAQATQVLAMLEAWWWTPGVRELRLQVKGEPVATLGPLAVTQPLARGFYTFVLQPDTGEVGYLVGSLNPRTPAEALGILQRREIREFPAARGFRPLLPVDATIVPAFDKLADGVLPVNITGAFSPSDHARLAAVVLHFTQFPEITAVRFTFNGETVNELFMRGNLNAPLTPRDLLLPAAVALPATATEAAAVRAAVIAALGKEPAGMGASSTWREWAKVPVYHTLGAETHTYLLRQAAGTYSVQASGANLMVTPDLLQKVPREALIALRVPGWEALAQ
ncbi:MAG: GerMN domain-containing protein [Armatimonadota bacterium]